MICSFLHLLFVNHYLASPRPPTTSFQSGCRARRRAPTALTGGAIRESGTNILSLRVYFSQYQQKIKIVGCCHCWCSVSLSKSNFSFFNLFVKELPAHKRSFFFSTRCKTKTKSIFDLKYPAKLFSVSHEDRCQVRPKNLPSFCHPPKKSARCTRGKSLKPSKLNSPRRRFLSPSPRLCPRWKV